MWTEHRSEIDDSVNFVKTLEKSVVECRYVRRQDNQVVIYLSSHNGCSQACRFCHLTATRQTEMEPASIHLFSEQAKVVNFNFMARGEPLLNPSVIGNWWTLYNALKARAQAVGLKPIFNISTIIPENFVSFQQMFGPRQLHDDIRIYWSLYSPNEKFRKRWLPKAKNPYESAQLINNYREYGGKVVLHNTFIKGENDTEEQIDELLEFIRYCGLRELDFNIVAYNPYDTRRHGENSDRTDRIFEKLSNYLTGRVQIITCRGGC